MKATLLLLLIIFSIASSFPIPCGRCKANFESCEDEPCADNLNCVVLKTGAAKVCMPTIEHGQPCNDTKLYDPCEQGFACDRFNTGKCIPLSRYAELNDGCINDDYCKTGLTCYNGVCKLSGGQCANNYECLWNQYCDRGANGGCKSLAAPGESCLTRTCKYGSSCLFDTITNANCVEDFTLAEGAKCTAVKQCKYGLNCDPDTDTCSKPKYSKLLGPGALWGPACYPGFQTGCKCNYAVNTYQFLNEQSATYKDFCGQRQKDFDKCMTDKQCSAKNEGADTCYRKNCWSLDKLIDECLLDPSLVPQRCGATGILVAMISLVLLLLI